MNLGVPLAHLRWEDPNAHLDDSLNICHLCFLFTLLEVSPHAAWASSCGKSCQFWQCLLGSRAPSHWPTKLRMWIRVSACFLSKGWWRLGWDRGGGGGPVSPLLEPLVPHPECLVWDQPPFEGGLSPGGDTGLWGVSLGHENNRSVHVTIVISCYPHHRESFKSWAFAEHVQELFLKHK